MPESALPQRPEPSGSQPLRRGAVGYLLHLGLIEPEEVVSNGIDVELIRGKNLSYKVSVGHRSFLIKSATTPQDIGIIRERLFYERVREENPSLQRFTPTLLGGDSQSRIVLQFKRNHVDLRRYFSKSHPIPLKLANELAGALAAIHDIAPRVEPEYQAPQPLPLALLAPDVVLFLTESPGTIDIVRRVQSNPIFADLITRCASHWPADGFSHGDLRLANVLRAPNEPLVVVDWELSGVGWTAWDIGSVFASCVEFWITGVLRPASRPDNVTTAPARRLVRFQPFLQAFWREYCRLRKRQPAWLQQSKTMAGVVAVRLLQSALEYSQMSTAPTRESIMLLTLAQRFASQRMESWVHILGLPL